MKPLREPLQGKKTYITGILMVVFGATGYVLGKIPAAEAIQLITSGLGFIFVRLGLKNSL